MATAKRSKKKKSSRLGKIAKFINPRSLKGGMALFALVFALAGGGYLVYRSYAATIPYPPTNLRWNRNMNNLTINGTYIHCISAAGSTGYGPIANCQQWRPQQLSITCDKMYKGLRTGFYSPITKAFTPTSEYREIKESCTMSQVSPVPATLCKNINNYFVPSSDIPTPTAYGDLLFGTLFRYYNGKWQVKWASYSLITRGCSTSSDWMDASPW